MKIENKAAIKAVYEFVKKSSKEKKTKFILAEGVALTVSYFVTFDGEDWEYEVNDEEFKFTGAAKKLFGVLNIDPDDLIRNTDVDYEKLIKLDELHEQFDILANKAGLEDDDRYEFSTEMVENYDTWTEFWSAILDDVEDASKPKPIEYRLNSGYTAIIDTSEGLIKVGCQRFPIDVVRGLVAEYDKVLR